MLPIATLHYITGTRGSTRIAAQRAIWAFRIILALLLFDAQIHDLVSRIRK